jgi:hypothetical protein
MPEDWMKTITLSQGKVALVDDEDFDWLSKFRWYAKRPNSTSELFYAVAHVPGTRRHFPKVKMHKLLLPDAKEVDHINGDSLDNQRHNLRAVTKSQNMMNMKRHRDNVSGFKGVSRHQKRWCARIHNEFLGTFPSAIEAARAYDVEASARFGQFARLNFPEQKNG